MYKRSNIMFMTRIWLTSVFCISLGLSHASSSSAAETTINNSPSADIQTPVFAADGRIVCGSKSLWQKQRYAQVLMCIDNDAICTLLEIFNLGKEDIGPIFFKNKKNKLIGNSDVYTAEVRDAISSDKKLGTYKLSVSLLEDGLIRVDSTCLLNDPTLLKNRYSIFQFPPYMPLSGEYIKGDKSVSFDEKSPITFSGDDLAGATIEFFPGSKEKSFSIIPDGCSKVRITPNGITFHAKQSGIMSFLLDIRGTKAAQDKSELSPNGIDFWEIDKLHLPDYGACRNLILNPSFESGFRFWGYPSYAQNLIPLKHQNFYELDDKEVYSGSHSLRISALSLKNPLPLGTMAIPFVSGKRYTLSFYAKGSFDKNLVVNLWGRELRHINIFSESDTTFPVDRQWRRYTTSFVPNDRFGGIYFRAQAISAASDQQEGSVWIDNIQLEEGSLTDFVQPPVNAQLVSIARGNFLRFGQKPDFNLIVRSEPDTKGTVSISVEDFFFKKIFEETYSFTTDSMGESTISLHELSNSVLKNNLRGVFSVTSVFNIDRIARPFNDYFRFSVMDFLDNTHKNKNLFTVFYAYSLQAGGPDMERFLARERAIGFGSFAMDFGSFANDLDYSLDQERMQLVEKYGIEAMGRPVLMLHGGIDGEISEENGVLKMINIRSTINPTEEELLEFENICAVKARNRPWNKIWWFVGESNPGCMPLESHPEAFAKFLQATLRGIKKGNPEAKVLISGGPYNLTPKYGTKWVERYIQDAKRIDPTAQFDGAAAHHYRNFPENPDLDSDIAVFIEMLDRNGCEDWPLYINEGGNYCSLNIPQEGISPYIVHSANTWYFGPLSYHIGRSERIASAFSARNWLIGLKYQDRVACMQDFRTPNNYMDIDFTPRVYDKMPNTLGRLLGNASFYKDIRFAPYVRCYVFKNDNTGSPIAAIWGHKEGVDRWKESPPLYAFDFGGQDVKFIDLMENEVSFPKNSDGRTVIPMSPFPLFIKGLLGTEQQLCHAIANADAASEDAEVLEVHAFPNPAGIASVVFKNTISRDFNGQIKIDLNGKEHHLKLNIPQLEQTTQPFDLQQSYDEYGKILPFDFTSSVDGGSSLFISSTYMLLKNNSKTRLTVGGNPSDWENIPAIDLGAGFFVRMTVSEGNLLVAIEAKDQIFASPDVFDGTGLYIEPFGKTDQWHVPKVAKQDLAVFEFVKTKENVLEAFCHYVQGTQAGSGSSYLVRGQVQKKITVKTSATGDAAFIVFSVPQEVLLPLIIEPGSRFGINISVPLEKDGVKTLAPIRDFKSPVEPGEINFVMVIVCDS